MRFLLHLVYFFNVFNILIKIGVSTGICRYHRITLACEVDLFSPPSKVTYSVHMQDPDAWVFTALRRLNILIKIGVSSRVIKLRKGQNTFSTEICTYQSVIFCARAKPRRSGLHGSMPS